MSEAHDKLFPLCVMFTSRDIQKSIDFYKNELGFEVETLFPEKNPVYAGLHLDYQCVMFGALMSPEAAGDFDCGADKMELAKKDYENFQKNRSGVGTTIYLKVKDVDKYYDTIRSKGVKPLTAPVTEFYGQRDFIVEDPDGYRLVFYTPVTVSSCQSCGMPLKDSKPGVMYCQYCTDSEGQLKPYKEVFEGTVSGYFIAMQKMARPEAEKAAKAHLATMPAWKGKHS